MLKDIVVDARLRHAVGKNESRRLRRQGLVPGIVYGGDGRPVAVAVEPRQILTILHSDAGANTLFTLRLEEEENGKRTVMIREVQRDPVAGKLIHADFVRIDMSHEITVKVPVHLSGVPVGVKAEGGLLDFVQREVEIACLPVDIPGSIEVDVSGLRVGQHLTIGDIKLAEKLRLVSDPAQTLAVVALPRAEAEAAPAVEEAAAAPAEPEVIRKGKEAAPEEAEEKGKEGKEGKEEKGKGESKSR